MADEEVAPEEFDEGDVDGEAAAAEVDEELEAMKSKVKEMEDEAEKLRKIQEGIEEQMQGPGEAGGEEGNAEADARSVYVGSVDYSATPEELQEHFAGCGIVNRVTILCDKFRNPKGFAYLEFAEPEAVAAAEELNESEFKGRQLKVVAKRTNVPGMGGRGRGRGRGRGPPAYAKGGKGGKGKGYKGYQPFYRPRYRRGYRPY
uniref:RRM domain-containing protein n=1 Tax=Haptolina ericina TaxID=156174 RepID=A0A7S3F491_9EUKA